MMLGLGLSISRAAGSGGFSGLDLNFAEGRYAYNSPYSSELPEAFTFSRDTTALALVAGEYVEFAVDAPVIVPGVGLQVYAETVNLLQQDRPADTRYWGSAGGAALTADDLWNGSGYLYNDAAVADGVCTGSIDIEPGTATSVRVNLWQNLSTPTGYVTVDLMTGAHTPSSGAFSARVRAEGEGWRIDVTASLTGTGPRVLMLSNANGTLTPRRAQINAGGPRPYVPRSPAGTNRTPHSEPEVADLTVSGNASDSAAPSGSPLSAGTWLDLNNAGGVAYAYQSLPGLSAAAAVVISAYVYAADGVAPIADGGTAGRDFTFVVGGDDRAGTPLVEPVATNIWRVGLATTVGASYTLAGVVRYAGQNTRPLKFSGLMVEDGPVLTPYIATNGAAATRLATDGVRGADVATVNDIPLGIAGTVVIDFLAPPATGALQVYLRTAAALLLYSAGATSSVYSYQTATETGLNSGATLTPGQRYRAALTWEPGRWAVAVTGFDVQSGVVDLDPADWLQIGHGYGVDQANTSIRLVAHLDRQASDAELEALTELPV